MPFFHRYFGIDYSGASLPTTPLPGLTVFVAGQEGEPLPQVSGNPRTPNWDRERLAFWLRDRLLENVPTVVGIDHAFSYPLHVMAPEARGSWDEFLEWFETCWPTQKEAVQKHSQAKEAHLEQHRRSSRLTDDWTSTAMPIFKGWKGNQGPNVFFSTHAGIPWLRWLRQETAGKVHFWPFDGLKIPAGKSVIAEVYPRIFRRRYEWDVAFTDDQRDAWLVCKWLKDRDGKDRLAQYFQPPLEDAEERRAQVEGWILGVF
jgi:hypothetical protein